MCLLVGFVSFTSLFVLNFCLYCTFIEKVIIVYNNFVGIHLFNYSRLSGSVICVLRQVLPNTSFFIKFFRCLQNSLSQIVCQ